MFRRILQAIRTRSQEKHALLELSLSDDHQLQDIGLARVQIIPGIEGKAKPKAWRFAFFFTLIALLGSQAAQSEDAPLSPKTIAAFNCLEKFAVELDDHTSAAASTGAVVASHCTTEFEVMADEGADEETHNFLERETFMQAAREAQNEFATQFVLIQRAKRAGTLGHVVADPPAR